MCLIALALDPTPGLKLVLVANRDEFHARPSDPMGWWPEHPHVLAGRDVEAGGTWLGLSTRGRLIAVTNVRLPGPPAAGLRSRGALARQYLEGSDTAAQFLTDRASALAEFGPCNLLVADRHTLLYASNQPRIPTQRLVGAVHGLSNAALDTPWPKTRCLKAALADWLAADHPTDTAALFTALADARQPADDELPDTGVGLARERFVAPAFIVGREYGTRCSTVIVIDAAGQGVAIERRFGPDGVALGESQNRFEWPLA